jgi:hypothetical protein
LHCATEMIVRANIQPPIVAEMMLLDMAGSRMLRQMAMIFRVRSGR